MKTIVVLLALFVSVCRAEVISTVTPSGTCDMGAENRYNPITGDTYGCKNSAWTLIGSPNGSVALPFSSVTAGTNAAALLIGTGGSLGVSGSGTIAATSCQSATSTQVLVGSGCVGDAGFTFDGTLDMVAVISTTGGYSSGSDKSPIHAQYTVAGDGDTFTSIEGRVSVEENMDNNVSSAFGGHFVSTISGVTNPTSIEGVGVRGRALNSGDGAFTRSSGALTGAYFDAVKVGSGAMTRLQGILASADIQDGSATNSFGVVSQVTGGTVTNAVGVEITLAEGVGAFTNSYGVRVNDIAGASTINRAIDTGTGLVAFGDDLIFKNDNTDDIGASGATRPRNVYAGTGFIAGAAVGQSVTTTVRDAAGTGTCTLVFTGGLKTGGTC